MAASGSQTAALSSGGTPSSPQSNLTATEEWTISSTTQKATIS